MPWDFSVLSDISGWAVAAGVGLLVLRMLLKGTLVAKSVHEEMRAERNTWRETAMTLLKSDKKKTELLDDARIAMRANTAILQALPLNIPEEGTDEGDTDEH